MILLKDQTSTELATALAELNPSPRLVRQLLVEASLLAAGGGALGGLLAGPAVARLGLPASAWQGRNFYGVRTLDPSGIEIASHGGTTAQGNRQARRHCFGLIQFRKQFFNGIQRRTIP